MGNLLTNFPQLDTILFGSSEEISNRTMKQLIWNQEILCFAHSPTVGAKMMSLGLLCCVNRSLVLSSSHLLYSRHRYARVLSLPACSAVWKFCSGYPISIQYHGLQNPNT